MSGKSRDFTVSCSTKPSLLKNVIACQQKIANFTAREYKFGVTTRTIYHNIEKLVCSHPVKVIRGRYGGVKLEDWFYPDSRFLAPEQFMLLISMKDRVTREELVVLNSILIQFAP